ncbi:MAG: hypothetical protein VX938_06565, partial [Myxococcota bacterium]|nr:hypothetical protein [Myxococcota bacterium]
MKCGDWTSAAALLVFGLTVVGCGDTNTEQPGDGTGTPDVVESGPDSVGSEVSTDSIGVTVCALVEKFGAMACADTPDADMDLGALAPGESAQGGLRLTNIGASDVVYDGAAFLEAGEVVVSAQMSTSGAPGTTLGPGETLDVWVSISKGLPPGDLPAGEVALTLTASDDPTNQVVLTVRIEGSVAECPQGTGSCDGDWSNGCEQDTATSSAHCGGCDVICEADNGESTCEEGVCVTVCAPGWIGEDCASDIDECAIDDGGCDPLTQCANTEGSFECSACPDGYSGTGLAGCEDIDECAADNGGCDLLSTCTNSDGGFNCGECPAGYTGDGLAGCVDVDECATENGGCASLTTCTNTDGGFECGACPTGYEGDGLTGCADVDECLTDNGGCDVLVSCTNTDGGFECGACPTGYEGDGLTGCADVDECLTNNGGCDALAPCNNTDGAFTCGDCPEGYTGG